MTIKVDQEKCVGCGMCAGLCPEVFAMTDDGKSKVIADDCGDCDCQSTIDSCPVSAISME